MRTIFAKGRIVVVISLFLFTIMVPLKAPYPWIVDLNLGDEDVRILGIDEDDRFGNTMAVGDFNGDGYDDMIIGAFFGEPAGRTQTGEAYVFLGDSSLPSNIDLKTDSADMTIYGEADYDLLGYAITSGNVNGDQYDDIIISATGGDGSGGIEVGKVFVIFGKSSLPNQLDLSSEPADLTISGDNSGEQNGMEMAAGDINGDGFDDIIFGARFADPGGRSDAGKSCVIFGGSSMPNEIDLNIQPADMTIWGDNSMDRLGRGISSGDINNDGFDDIVVCAYWADPDGRSEAGKAYVIFGQSAPPVVIDLNSENADLTILGDDAYGWLGRVTSSGDINGDGFDDIIAGAYKADPIGRSNAGKVYVIFGGAMMSGLIDLSVDTSGIAVYGESAGDLFGYIVTNNDVNKDGYSDLIIGAKEADPEGRTNAGQTYLIFGSASPPALIDLFSESADMVILGENSGDKSSHGIASGDINGDGFVDIVVGAEFAGPTSGHDAGAVYVIFGIGPGMIEATIDINPDTLNRKSKGKWVTCYVELPTGYDVEDIDVSSVANVKINDDELDDYIYAESKPTTIGDIDGDGIPDLMVKFDRQKLIDAVVAGDCVITLSGTLIDDTYFEGSDTIRVIH